MGDFDDDFSMPSAGGSSGRGGGSSDIQQLILQEQQRALIQEAVAKITEIAFDKCTGRPDTSFSSREKTCLQNVAMTYIDASQFISYQLSGGAQQ